MSNDGQLPSGQTTQEVVRRPDAQLGRVIAGRYELRSVLGRGGMGTVYLAWQASMSREVAVKLLAPEFRTDEASIKRFHREANIGAKLSVPSIVTVFDFGSDADAIYMAMELVRGVTVSQVLRTDGAFGWRRACKVLVQVCDALEAAHSKQVIHRDIKATNVMILDEPVGRDLVKVLDFGIATLQSSERLTKTDTVIGSPNAVAPETFCSPSSEPTPAVDLYALGSLAFEMLAAAPPFGTGDLTTVMRRQLAGPPPRPEVVAPPALLSMVVQLLDREPAARPQSAAMVRERLLALLDAPPGAATPRPRPLGWVLGLGTVTIAAIGFGVHQVQDRTIELANSSIHAQATAMTGSGTPDSGTPDSGTADSGTADSGTPNSGTPDSGTPDSGTPDSGSREGFELGSSRRRSRQRDGGIRPAQTAPEGGDYAE